MGHWLSSGILQLLTELLDDGLYQLESRMGNVCLMDKRLNSRGGSVVPFKLLARKLLGLTDPTVGLIVIETHDVLSLALLLFCANRIKKEHRRSQ